MRSKQRQQHAPDDDPRVEIMNRASSQLSWTVDVEDRKRAEEKSGGCCYCQDQCLANCCPSVAAVLYIYYCSLDHVHDAIPCSHPPRKPHNLNLNRCHFLQTLRSGQSKSEMNRISNNRFQGYFTVYHWLVWLPSTSWMTGWFGGQNIKITDVFLIGN